MKKLFILLTTIFTVAIVGYVASQPTLAQAPTAGQALEIAPPVLNLKADPGETITTQINIRGVSASSLRVTSQVNDFGAGDREDGTPVIMGLNEDGTTEPSPYSIIDWVRPLPEMTLRPREIQNLPVTINVPNDAAPGGYYGVVRFTATPADMDQTGVSLSASLGSLIFIRVSGEANESMDIVEFTSVRNKKGPNGEDEWIRNRLFEGTPVNMLLRVKNNGTVHEQPVGQAEVKDMFGKKLATLNFNLDRRNVLPGSVRQFVTPLDKSVIGNRWLFGRYTATIKVDYGESGQSATKSLAFWVIPWKLILGALILLLLIIFGFRYWLHRRDMAVSNRRYRRR